MVNIMKKETIVRFGKKRFLLGIRKEDNKKVYLTAPSWDCDWYWGFGYVNSFKINDTYTHEHFNGLFLRGDIIESFKNYFTETTLRDDEIYILLGYMKEFYVLKEMAALLQHGNHITSRAINILEEKYKEENEKEVYRINKIILPSLFEKIEKLFTESNEN